MDVSLSSIRLLINDLVSSQNVVRKNALKRLETVLLSKVDSQSVPAILWAEDGDRDRLGHILLDGLSDDHSPEICREKSAICLQIYVAKFLEEDDKRQTIKQKPFLQKFFVEFCTVFHARLSYSSSSNGSKMVEEAEEIRLILVQILSHVVIRIGRVMKNNNSPTSENGRGGEAQAHYKRTTAATSLVCQSLAASTLSDKYPDLKRAGCVLLKGIAEVFPHVVRMHGKSLLCPITGGSIHFGCAKGESRNGDIISKEQELCSSSKMCLLRHRHAKTRSLALETTTDIMLCCNTSAIDLTEDDVCQKGYSFSTFEDMTDETIPNLILMDINNGSSFSDLMASHVLPSLELFPPYDHSATVRTALSKTVGSLLRSLIKGDISRLEKQTSHEKILKSNNFESLQKTHISPTGRLLALLLMGLSDKAEIVRSKSSTEFQLIGVLWGEKQEEIGQPEIEGSHFFSVFALDIIIVLLLNILNTFSTEERTRSIEALNVTIQILNQKQCQFTGNNVVPYWDESFMTKIVIVLCKSFRESERVLFQAALDCSDALGSSQQSRLSASRIILTALSGERCPLNEPLETSLHSLETHTENIETLICSSPQQFASALYFLAGLIRGISSSEVSEASVDINEVDKISRIVTKERVLENAFVSRETAFALFDVCHTLAKSLKKKTKQKVNSDGGAYYDDGNYVVPNILYCCVFLLGCPDAYGLNQPVLSMLSSLSFALLGEGLCSEVLLGMHFRYIFDHITKETDKNINGHRKKWKSGDPDLCAFDALLRHSSGSAIGKHFEVISHILEQHLGRESSKEFCQPRACEQNGYETKLFVMASMESIVSNPSFPKDCLHCFVEKLIGSSIIPNLVWQVGGMASALRKLSAAVLFTMLSCMGDNTSTRGIFLLAPSLLPVLRSNLTDDDSSTRELVTASLEKLFKILYGALGEEAVYQFYPDLVKCLDDSSDSVRFATCNTLKQFLRAAPRENFRGTAINYIVEKLIIHMDDPDSNFQDMVFDVLVIASDVDSSVILKNIETALMSHKNQRLCNLLKEHVAKKMNIQKETRS